MFYSSDDSDEDSCDSLHLGLSSDHVSDLDSQMSSEDSFDDRVSFSIASSESSGDAQNNSSSDNVPPRRNYQRVRRRPDRFVPSSELDYYDMPTRRRERRQTEIFPVFQRDASPVRKLLPPEKECVVCMDSKKLVGYRPCLHQVACKKCTKNIVPQKCPVCRKNIDRVEKGVKAK